MNLKGLVEKFEDHASWANLTKVMKSPVLKYLSMVPIIAVFVVVFSQIDKGIAKAKEKPPLLGEAWAEIASQVVWNAGLLLVGGFFIGLAWIVYRLRVPSVCRRHPEIEDYLIEQKGIEFRDYQVGAQTIINCTTLNKQGAIDSKWNDRAPRPMRNIFHPGEMRASTTLKNLSKRNVAHFYWEALNHEKAISRLLCAGLLAVGVVLVAIPSAWTVLRAAWWLLFGV